MDASSSSSNEDGSHTYQDHEVEDALALGPERDEDLTGKYGSQEAEFSASNAYMS